MNIESNIWKYYLIAFLRDFQLVLPIYFLFFQENGLSVTQIMILLTVASLGAILFEIPSGVFADFFGRKKSIILGLFILSGGYTLISLTHEFTFFLVAYFIVTIGISFISGADTALLYDSLKEVKKEKFFKKIYGKVITFSNMGFAFGALTGGFVSKLGFRVNYMLFSAAIGLAFLISLSLSEPKVYKKVITKKYYQHMKESLSFCIRNKRVKWLVIFNGIMLGSMASIFTLWQPYMLKIGISVSSFGYMYVLFLLSASLTSYFAHDIEKKMGEKASFIAIPLLIFLPLILMSKMLFIFSLVFMVLVEFAFGYLKPVIDDYTNKHIESSRRATVMSISNMFMRLCWAVIGPVIGIVADSYSIVSALLFFGVFLGVVSVFVLVPLFRTNRFNNKI